ncbi:hydrophobic surface binding protein A-domain-containing protein [Gymnopilus junonius]|uniref:Hydrophobic surface binding protein A-domain-containing protein n=1 Tax=Gymnopilus junonius TaxID=109634 RepID=A0A9P5NJX8_GYMJU|nr:hydrophobic surface binding protein A-domain-containing protein [Gymnopilus junonius]
MKFQATFAIVASYVVAALASTVADVETDVQTISTQTTALDNAINAFPNTGGSLVSALAIHNDAVSLGSAIDQGTSDVSGAPQPFSETDGSAILTAVQGFEPTILDALTAIVTKKPAFQALPIGGIPALVLQDLQNLNTSAFNFEAALIAAAPADLVPTATSVKAAVDAAFATAIAAYS